MSLRGAGSRLSVLPLGRLDLCLKDSKDIRNSYLEQNSARLLLHYSFLDYALLLLFTVYP